MILIFRTFSAGTQMPKLPVVTQETVNGVTVVSFRPETVSITEETISHVSEGLLKAADADPPRLVVDMTHVEFFSSSFIEVLFRLWNRLKVKEGGRFALCNLHRYCREILEVANLHTIWEVYETREEAVAALGEKP